MFKRLLLSLSLMIFIPLAAVAQEDAKSYVEGTHYDLIVPSVRTPSQMKQNRAVTQ